MHENLLVVWFIFTERLDKFKIQEDIISEPRP